MKLKEKLTDYQRQYAEENHGLVLAYISRKRLPFDEYYCVVIPGYLRAVVNYDVRSDLSVYKFSTIAYRHMDSCRINYIRYNARRKNTLCASSLDAEYIQIPSSSTDYEDGLFWEQVYSSVSSKQRQVLDMKLKGYKMKEISEEMDLSSKNVYALIKTMKESLKHYVY